MDKGDLANINNLRDLKIWIINYLEEGKSLGFYIKLSDKEKVKNIVKKVDTYRYTMNIVNRDGNLIPSISFYADELFGSILYHFKVKNFEDIKVFNIFLESENI